MTQESTPQTPSESDDDLDTPLLELPAPLRRHWKLVVFGTALCWALLLLVPGLVHRPSPPSYRSEAVLSVPDVFAIPPAGVLGLLDIKPHPQEVPWVGGPKSGVPLPPLQQGRACSRPGAGRSGHLDRQLGAGGRRGRARPRSPVPPRQRNPGRGGRCRRHGQALLPGPCGRPIPSCRLCPRPTGERGVGHGHREGGDPLGGRCVRPADAQPDQKQDRHARREPQPGEAASPIASSPA